MGKAIFRVLTAKSTLTVVALSFFAPLVLARKTILLLSFIY